MELNPDIGGFKMIRNGILALAALALVGGLPATDAQAARKAAPNQTMVSKHKNPTPNRGFYDADYQWEYGIRKNTVKTRTRSRNVIEWLDPTLK
jgi:hypothetical protein